MKVRMDESPVIGGYLAGLEGLLDKPVQRLLLVLRANFCTAKDECEYLQRCHVCVTEQTRS